VGFCLCSLSVLLGVPPATVSSRRHDAPRLGALTLQWPPLGHAPFNLVMPRPHPPQANPLLSPTPTLHALSDLRPHSHHMPSSYTSSLTISSTTCAYPCLLVNLPYFVNTAAPRPFSSPLPPLVIFLVLVTSRHPHRRSARPPALHPPRPPTPDYPPQTA
jgi:hypothetical protein